MLFKILVIAGLLLTTNYASANTPPSFFLYPPLGVVYHPVSTIYPEAQREFNRGLLAVYAFNHDEAFRSFERASQIDPSLAMAYWGMALSLGENINTPITTKHELSAFELIQKALFLSEKSTLNEQAYIQALSFRYSNLSNPDKEALRVAYSQAMKKLVNDFPDDLDAATLYAESLMDLKPWRLWRLNGEPEAVTKEILDVIKYVLKQDPLHIGANHYFIHAIEASMHPEEGLICADRLYNLLPEWGHILHMPSHIFLLVGDYEKAALANLQAVQADENYIQEYGIQGYYPLHYMSHNLFFLCRAYMWQEQFSKAIEAANKLYRFLSPHISKMPELEYYLLAPLQVYLYFQKWEEIVKYNHALPELKGFEAFNYFAKSMAYLSLGQKDRALEARDSFNHSRSSLDIDERLGYNSAQQVLDIASDVLSSQFSKVQNDTTSMLQFLTQAVEKQDVLNYNEPPDWFYPIRQSLGAAYIKLNNFTAAEATFREALKRLPRNGRSLFGLNESLKLQKKSHYWIEREQREALKHAEYTLNLNDL